MLIEVRLLICIHDYETGVGLIYDACMFVCTKQENSVVLNGDVDR